MAKKRAESVLDLVGQTPLVRLKSFERALFFGSGPNPQEAQPGVGITQPPGEDIGHHTGAFDQVKLLKNHADVAADMP